MVQKIEPGVLRVELRDYIDNASDIELGELYAFINSKTPPYEWWNDNIFVDELERRFTDLKGGKDKGVSWEEVKKRLLNKSPKTSQPFNFPTQSTI